MKDSPFKKLVFLQDKGILKSVFDTMKALRPYKWKSNYFQGIIDSNFNRKKNIEATFWYILEDEVYAPASQFCD